MSNTSKNKKTFNKGKKLTPYIGNKKQRYKYTPEQAELPGTSKRISKAAKLEAKNANRSLKKAARQESKKDIVNDLLDLSNSIDLKPEFDKFMNNYMETSKNKLISDLDDERNFIGEDNEH